jgi:uncharacterized protein YgiB involved in biofilm formation
MKTMKRSSNMKVLTIGLLTVSAFALSGCQEENEAFNFKNVEQCISAAMQVDAGFSEKDCREGFSVAEAQYKETAPKYADASVCEAEHGVGACTTAQSSGGSSFFIPLMAGYMMGSLTSGSYDRDKKRSYTYVPMYSVRGGGYATTTGIFASSMGKKTYVSPSAVAAKPASTVKAAPMTSVTVGSRGGFGGAKIGGFGSTGG